MVHRDHRRGTTEGIQRPHRRRSRRRRPRPGYHITRARRVLIFVAAACATLLLSPDAVRVGPTPSGFGHGLEPITDLVTAPDRGPTGLSRTAAWQNRPGAAAGTGTVAGPLEPSWATEDSEP